MGLLSSAPEREFIVDPYNPEHEINEALKDLIWDKRKPNAKLCLSFVLNVEEGGEYTPYNGDKFSESRLCDLQDPPKEMRNLPIEQLYEYGARVGFHRVKRMLTERNLPCTVFAVGQCLEQNPAICKSLRELREHQGWEIASHGYRWVDYSTYTGDDEYREMRGDVRVQWGLLSNVPRGYYAGKPSMTTLSNITNPLTENYYYTNDIYNDDVPYWLHHTRRPSHFGQMISGRCARPLLAMPYSLVNNDMRLVTTNGIHNAHALIDEIIGGINFMVKETQTLNQSKMMSIGLHCRLAGQPVRAAAYQRLFDHVQKLRDEGKLVVQTRWQVAQNMFLNHYPENKASRELTCSERDELLEPAVDHLNVEK